MNYIHTIDTRPVVSYLAETIANLLADNKRVLWLVSGGSGGKVTTEAAKLLQNARLENLSVTLSDERYGPVGHDNENWNILLKDGFSLPGATLYRPLRDASRENTTRHFELWLGEQLKHVDYVIGLFGMGADGHTAGIKPHSVAVGAATFAAHYQGDDFERITITPAFIEHIDEGVVQILGEEKHDALQTLLSGAIDLADQPAQALRHIPKLTIYSDYQKEK